MTLTVIDLLQYVTQSTNAAKNSHTKTAHDTGITSSDLHDSQFFILDNLSLLQNYKNYIDVK